MSFRYAAGINKPGFNPLAAQSLLYNLFAWGANGSGQLGLGNTTDYSSPKQVGSLTNWSNVAMARLIGGAVKTDGTLWTWGWNANAQGAMGVGNETNYSSPKQVGALTTWLSVKIGQKHLLALDG